MTDREKIAARIRALRAKTVENGCTEGEAMAAAAKVAELLAAYNMTLDEADLRASPFTQHDEAHEDDVGKRLWKPAVAISKLTGSTFWASAPGVFPEEIHFFGLAHEVEVAGYLLEICARAMRGERDRIKARAGRMRPAALRNVLHPFLDGMADRLAERIHALIPPVAHGIGLVVVRGELMRAALDEAGIAIQQSAARTGQRAGPEYLQGRLAGDDVALNPGLRTGAAVATLAAAR